jgi:hypothetical protein
MLYDPNDQPSEPIVASPSEEVDDIIDWPEQQSRDD